MIVDYLHVVCVPLLPTKTDSPLVVDANAVLSGTITCQLLKAIAKGHAQVVERSGRIKLDKLAERDAVNALRQLPDRLSVEEAFSILIPETADHKPYINATR